MNRMRKPFAVYKNLVRQLIDDGLSCKEVASAINTTLDIVRKLDGRFFIHNFKKYNPEYMPHHPKKKGRKSKIDRDEFIKLWKNNAPYSVIANHFGVKRTTAMSYKSLKCRGIIKNIICPGCGNAFDTNKDNRRYCDSCRFEKSIIGPMIYKKKQRMKIGDDLEKIRLESEYQEELRKQEKRAKKAEERYWDVEI